MSLVLELFKAFLDLVLATTKNLPSDWNDESQIELWLGDQNKPLARVIALLVPDEAALPVAANKTVTAVGLPTHIQKTEAGEVDWDTMIDWVARMLIWMLPAYEQLIKVVAEMLKQLLKILPDVVKDGKFTEPELRKLSG